METKALVRTILTSSNTLHLHVLCSLGSLGSLRDSIAARGGSTYDSWQWSCYEELNQAEGRPCPFPTELHSPAAAKTLSACRELSFTDASEFTIASILRNWLYPVWGKQGKDMPGDLPKVTSLIYWRAWNGGEIELLAPSSLINNQIDMSSLTPWSKSKLIKPALGVNIIKSVETWLISD